MFYVSERPLLFIQLPKMVAVKQRCFKYLTYLNLNIVI